MRFKKIISIVLVLLLIQIDTFGLLGVSAEELEEMNEEELGTEDFIEENNSDVEVEEEIELNEYVEDTNLNEDKNGITEEVKVENNNSKATSSTSQIPDLKGYQSDKGVKLEWAVEMLDEDVLYETGFEEGDELPRLTYNISSTDPQNRLNGGQSITTEDKYSGKRSLKVENSYSNGNYKTVDLKGDTKGYQSYSRSSFRNRRYVENGVDLSLSFRAKTSGRGAIVYKGGGGTADYGTPWNISFLEDVKIGDTTAKVSDITEIKSYVDRGEHFYIADQKGRYNYIHVTKVDEKEKEITVNKPFKGEFKKGDDVLKHSYREPVSFPKRTIEKGDGWTLINVNTKVQNYENYNTIVRGFELALHVTTYDNVYIDDLKMGHATKANLYRGNTKIYEGYLSDYEDTQAKDKAKPNKVTKYTVEQKGKEQKVVLTEPKDVGTVYDYTVESESHNGVTYKSEKESVEVVSGIDGYSYVIDKSKSTIPSGKVNNKDGNIVLTGDVTNEHYLHVQAVDKEGNKSDVSHFKLDEVKDLTDPEVKLTQKPTGWTKGSVEIDVDTTGSVNNVKSVSYLGDNILQNGDFREGDNYWKPSQGTFYVKDGILHLKDNEGKNNLVYQPDAFQGTVVGESYYAEIEARGNGVLNARYAFKPGVGGIPQRDYQVNVTPEFKKYRFLMKRFEHSNDNFMVERIGKGDIEIRGVTLYGEKEITDGKLEVTENGTYNFVIEDDVGNIVTKSITVTNIDKEEPKVTIKPSTTKKTNKNVTLKVDAKDEGSGVKKIVYLGESMIENGDFKNGKERWTSSAGNFEVKDGVMSLKDNTVNDNKVYQQKAFIGSEIGASYYAEMDARGSGVLNARYAVKTDGTGEPQREHKVTVTNVFERYRFFMERGETSTDSFMIERVGKGELEVKNVEVYAEKDITDTKELEVTKNGTYTFVVEDNVGNITTESYTVDNIDKEPPEVTITPSTKEFTHENVILNVDAKDPGSGIKSITYIGENMVKNGDFKEGSKHWRTSVGGGGLTKITEGKAIFQDEGVAANKLAQTEAFNGTSKDVEYIGEVTARGEGILNLRYGQHEGAVYTKNQQKLKSKDVFEKYFIKLVRIENSSDVLMVERRGPGYMEVSNVSVYEQKDITDTRKLEVTQNGTYTFVVEDNVGNITTKSYTVNNIDKTISMDEPKVKHFEDVKITKDKNTVGTDIGTVKVKDWRDGDNKWKLNVSASPLKEIGSERTLSEGTLQLKGIKGIKHVKGEGTLPKSLISKPTIIDSGDVTLIEGNGSRGEYDIEFPSNALEMTVDPKEIKKGNYETTVTWEVITGP